MPPLGRAGRPGQEATRPRPGRRPGRSVGLCWWFFSDLEVDDHAARDRCAQEAVASVRATSVTALVSSICWAPPVPGWVVPGRGGSRPRAASPRPPDGRRRSGRRPGSGGPGGSTACRAPGTERWWEAPASAMNPDGWRLSGPCAGAGLRRGERDRRRGTPPPAAGAVTFSAADARACGRCGLSAGRPARRFCDATRKGSAAAPSRTPPPTCHLVGLRPGRRGGGGTPPASPPVGCGRLGGIGRRRRCGRHRAHPGDGSRSFFELEPKHSPHWRCRSSG